MQEGNRYSLYGYKWFSSATDADMTLTLARIQSPEGTTVEGNKGISMFYVKTRRPDGTLNNIQAKILDLSRKL